MLYLDMRPGGFVVFRRDGRPTFTLTYGQAPKRVGDSMPLVPPGECRAIGTVTRAACKGKGNGVARARRRFAFKADFWEIDGRCASPRPRRVTS